VDPWKVFVGVRPGKLTGAIIVRGGGILNVGGPDGKKKNREMGGKTKWTQSK